MKLVVKASGRPAVTLLSAGETFDAALERAKALAKQLKGAASVTLVKA
jgi:hypothetical protein